jgi:8-oxo-dGTP pyrophosphatase MutT (NUDIX family)
MEIFTSEDIASVLSRHHPNVYGPEKTAGYARAAVLIALVQGSEGLSLLLTRRTESVETHKGQISFPGGVQDHPGERAVETALRETKEELGIEPGLVEILGMLDEKLVPTKFVITPVVGYLKHPPAITIHPGEVAEVFSVPLSFFADDANASSEQRLFEDRTVTVWHFHYQQHHIWGATAAIIRDLVELIHSK